MCIKIIQIGVIFHINGVDNEITCIVLFSIVV